MVVTAATALHGTNKGVIIDALEQACALVSSLKDRSSFLVALRRQAPPASEGEWQFTLEALMPEFVFTPHSQEAAAYLQRSITSARWDQQREQIRAATLHHVFAPLTGKKSLLRAIRTEPISDLAGLAAFEQ